MGVHVSYQMHNFSQNNEPLPFYFVSVIFVMNKCDFRREQASNWF